MRAVELGMKGALAVVMVALAACTEPGASGQSSSTASPSASLGAVAVVVGPTANSAGTHSVYLIGPDGHVLADATATNRIPITTWVANSPILDLWSAPATASGTRA